MKNLLLVLAIASSGSTYGQKKKNTRYLPPPSFGKAMKAEEPQSLSSADSKQCFVYKDEVVKDAMTYVTETLLEYDQPGSRARMIFTTYKYDALLKNQANESGEVLTQTQQLQFIDGNYKIDKGTLTMTPDKNNKYEIRHFKLVTKPKVQTVINLKDEQNHFYKKGKCLEPMISI